MASPTKHEGRREADGADYSVEWAAPDFHLKATARPRAHPIRAHPITLDLNLTLALALALSLSLSLSLSLILILTRSTSARWSRARTAPGSTRSPRRLRSSPPSSLTLTNP